MRFFAWPIFRLTLVTCRPQKRDKQVASRGLSALFQLKLLWRLILIVWRAVLRGWRHAHCWHPHLPPPRCCPPQPSAAKPSPSTRDVAPSNRAVAHPPPLPLPSLPINPHRGYWRTRDLLRGWRHPPLSTPPPTITPMPPLDCCHPYQHPR